MLLENKVALITGGANGIGRATALYFAREGAKVVIADLEATALEAARQEIAAVGGEVVAAAGNVTLRPDVQGMVDAALHTFGRLDILINNAGITRDGTLMKMSFEAWRAVIDTDLTSCFNMAKAVFPGMVERKFGRIVNVSSINGQGGQYGQVNYSAAKAGIHGFTKALALEGARFGVTVNSLAPGYTDTDMVAAVPPQAMEKVIAKIPVGRLGKAEEIARGVLFLVADDAGFITGSTVSINGGQHMY